MLCLKGRTDNSRDSLQIIVDEAERLVAPLKPVVVSCASDQVSQELLDELKEFIWTHSGEHELHFNFGGSSALVLTLRIEANREVLGFLRQRFGVEAVSI